MKISENVRKFAVERKIFEEQALRLGLEQKAKVLVDQAEVYAKA